MYLVNQDGLVTATLAHIARVASLTLRIDQHADSHFQATRQTIEPIAHASSQVRLNQNQPQKQQLLNRKWR
jgi:hypothetical protein